MLTNLVLEKNAGETPDYRIGHGWICEMQMPYGQEKSQTILPFAVILSAMWLTDSGLCHPE